MAKMFGMCFNWKVLVALGVVGFGIWVIAPNLLLKSLPFLVLAACPITMLVMAWGMKRGMGGTHDNAPVSHEDSPQPAQVDPQERLARLEAERQALEQQIAAARNNGEVGKRPALRS